jgi:small subunit ribosomal protein S16
MSVVIRMKRAGAKKRPFYRVVVADSRSARDGRYIEQLGYYDPLTDPAKFQIDAVKFEQWIRKGAKPSESVEVMMAKHAPSALRPAPLPRLVPEETPAHAAGAAAKAPKAKKAKKAAKTGALAARKPRTATKASQKKAKTKAKAKARKASGVAKPGRTKKAKKSKK